MQSELSIITKAQRDTILFEAIRSRHAEKVFLFSVNTKIAKKPSFQRNLLWCCCSFLVQKPFRIIYNEFNLFKCNLSNAINFGYDEQHFELPKNMLQDFNKF